MKLSRIYVTSVRNLPKEYRKQMLGMNLRGRGRLLNLLTDLKSKDKSEVRYILDLETKKVVSYSIITQVKSSYSGYYEANFWTRRSYRGKGLAERIFFSMAKNYRHFRCFVNLGRDPFFSKFGLSWYENEWSIQKLSGVSASSLPIKSFRKPSIQQQKRCEKWAKNLQRSKMCSKKKLLQPKV